MLVYLDTCSPQRPLDDKSQLRIRLEAEAVLGVIDLVESGEVDLISSDALSYESERNPHPTRRQFVWEVVADGRSLPTRRGTWPSPTQSRPERRR